MVSNIGSLMQMLAVQHLVFTMTKSAVWLGFDAFATWIPMNLMLPFGGALADRLDRRRVVIVGNLLLGLIAAVLAGLYALDRLHVIHLIIASALSGVISGVVFPAFQSMVPNLVERKDMANAVALNAVQFNLSRAIGPAAGGLAMALGAAWCFGLNAASFVGVIVSTMMISWRPTTSMNAGGVLGSVIDGVKYAASRRDLVLIESAVVALAFCVSPLLTMLPAYVDAYGYNEVGATSALAALMSCFGLGAVVGATFNALRGRTGAAPWKAMPLMAVFGVVLALIGFLPPFPLAVALVALGGGLFMTSGNMLYSSVMASVPDRLRGRISSLHFISFGIGLPVGSLVAGTVAQGLGIHTVFVTYGVVMVLSVGLVVWYLRSRGVEFQVDGHLSASETGQESMP